MVIDSMHKIFMPKVETIRSWADYQDGIGFDQLLILQKGKSDSDCKLRIFNADGSKAEQCGNGVRCVALFMKERGISDSNPLKIELGERDVTATILSGGEVRVDMGVPLFEPADIPVLWERKQKSYLFVVNGEQREAGLVSLGNPHAVFIVEELDTYPVEKVGKAMQENTVFSQGVNVGFMQVLADNHIKLRVFERGAGETEACGSGSCAAAVIGHLWGLLKDEVNVQMRQGLLKIQWEGEGKSIQMSGPAGFVHDGTISI